ncbi:MAG: DUF2505 domain-containing protein [Panacagrimonas sp.]
MPLQTSFRFLFPRSDLQVTRRYSDSDYFRAMAETIGGTSVDVLQAQARNGIMQTQLRMQLDPLMPLPGFARKFINGAIRIEQTVIWNSSERRGQMVVTSSQIPYRAESRFRVEADGEHCAVISDWTVHIRIPLVSAPLERIAAKEVEMRLQAERDAADRLMPH